jgi:hypothetical protein
MPRVRSFDLPHKALRNVIAKFSFRLGSVEVTDPKQLESLKQLGEEMFSMLKNHVHTENEHTLRHIESRAPGSGDHDRADHERLEVIQDDLQYWINQLSGSESPDEMHNLYLEFSRFHSQYLEHIFEEETVTEILLQKHFTDDELLQFRTSIMQHMEFPMMLLWLKYAVPAQAEEQSFGLLSGFKTNAPADVFEQVLTVIKSEMTPEAYQRLLNRLA